MKDAHEMLAELEKPFPANAIQERQGFKYVKGDTVIRRINAATDGTWDFRILKIESRDVEVPARNNKPARTDLLMMATVELYIPGLGTRQHVGVQMVSPGGGEDLTKGCVTDALKKAATLFGVGLELYGADYEGEIAERSGTMNQAMDRLTDAARLDIADGANPRELVEYVAEKMGLESPLRKGAASFQETAKAAQRKGTPGSLTPTQRGSLERLCARFESDPENICKVRYGATFGDLSSEEGGELITWLSGQLNAKK